MELKTLNKIQKKSRKHSQADFLRIGIAILFLCSILFLSISMFQDVKQSLFLAFAALFGGYMAMNIGANDVANNVGPAVGSRALTMAGAILLAAIFESAGALIAGGDVVGTIKKKIIDPAFIPNANVFIWAMTASLLAAAVWLNVATALGAPVSTTHAIVGGIMGAGLAAAGPAIVSWDTMAKIVASWVISPVLGGLIAAAFLYFIKKNLIYKKDKISASKRVVPLLVAVMLWAFVTYLMLKGVKHIIKVAFWQAALIGLVAAALGYLVLKPMIGRQADKLKNNRRSLNRLFTIPLIFSAALLSFAHGANDVANAIGPLAAVNDALVKNAVSSRAPIPPWVMLIGALGISLGLALYGPKLIRTVGSEITELDQMRAYSIAMAAAITVILASQLGLPVSSTHIAVGGVFGVGFLREWLFHSEDETRLRKERSALRDDKRLLKQYKAQLKKLEEKSKKDKNDYKAILKLYRDIETEEERIGKEKKNIKNIEKEKFVQRRAVKKIVAAWVITVPAAAFLSAAFFFMIKGIAIPY